MSEEKKLNNNELNNKGLCEEITELSMEDLEQVTGGLGSLDEEIKKQIKEEVPEDPFRY